MKDLTPMEKEFKTKMMLAVNESEKWGYPPNKTIDIFAKASAALCERKMREAIELASQMNLNHDGTLQGYSYTKEEIIKKLTNENEG